MKHVLAVVAALFGIVMIFIAPGAASPAFHYVFGAFCLSIAGVCYAKGRVQQFLGSLVASAIVAVTAWYLIEELRNGPIISGSRSEPSVVNAVLALLVFGFPAAGYLLATRFGFGSRRSRRTGQRRRTATESGPSSVPAATGREGAVAEAHDVQPKVR